MSRPRAGRNRRWWSRPCASLSAEGIEADHVTGLVRDASSQLLQRASSCTQRALPCARTAGGATRRGHEGALEQVVRGAYELGGLRREQRSACLHASSTSTSTAPAWRTSSGSINATSVTLSSEELGLIAKIDVLEPRGDAVVDLIAPGRLPPSRRPDGEPPLCGHSCRSQADRTPIARASPVVPDSTSCRAARQRRSASGRVKLCGPPISRLRQTTLLLRRPP